MAKRKRFESSISETASGPLLVKTLRSISEAETEGSTTNLPETLQIVLGSYDQVLHGFTARIGDQTVEFADTFLFNAHRSAIRCVAVSPPSPPVPGQAQKVLLASGSTDERVNIYNLSAHPPDRKDQEVLAEAAPRPILENPKNREVGTLLHHASTIAALHFPTRSKLVTASEDSTISVARTRDWSVLSTIKAPIPKPQGRPSGDTAPFGGAPSGLNDFAIHPSMKLMISLSKGERCMRLWNLITGKKAGILSFDKEMLHEVGEGRHSTGEGRKVVWGSADGADEFAVGFDRDVVVFGMDSVPKCRLMPAPRIKIHQFTYITIDRVSNTALVALCTEDGRILFFSTRVKDLSPPERTKGRTATLPVAKLLGSVGGKAEHISGRIKDILVIPSRTMTGALYVLGASSEGKVRFWTVQTTTLLSALAKSKPVEKPLGKLLGIYETQSRITCMTGYLMIARTDDLEESEMEEVPVGEDLVDDSDNGLKYGE